MGMVKGLWVTIYTMFRTIFRPGKYLATVNYPVVKETPVPRARGVIALDQEACTVCMLCARNCPDWCIYIEGHKEEKQPDKPGGPGQGSGHARSLRHRLCPLHVLRDLRRGLPVRRPVLEPRVRVLRAPRWGR